MDRRTALLALCVLALLLGCRRTLHGDDCVGSGVWLPGRASLSGDIEVASETLVPSAAAASPGGFELDSHPDSTDLEVRFDPPLAVGMYRLEDLHAVAILSTTAERVALTGTLEVVDVLADVEDPPPTTPPPERPWGWEMKTTDGEIAIDVRAVSQPRWVVPDTCYDD